MDEKHPDLDPLPPYAEMNQQHGNNADVSLNTGGNIVEAKNGVLKVSRSVIVANTRIAENEPYGKKEDAWVGGKCLWQHCNNIHPHRHFWALGIYDYDIEDKFGEAFKGIENKCGWAGCTSQPEKGHWHTFKPRKGSKQLIGNFTDALYHPANEDLALAFDSHSLRQGFVDVLHGKLKKDYLKDLEDFGWVRKGFYPDRECNAGT